jgi:hypothetical protein
MTRKEKALIKRAIDVIEGALDEISYTNGSLLMALHNLDIEGSPKLVRKLEKTFNQLDLLMSQLHEMYTREK